MKTKYNNRDIARPQWLKESVPILPAGVFVWRDELETSWHRFSAQAGTRKGERPNDGMLNFSPLISPPETRAIVMEGFEGLPLAATSPPIVGEEPERARDDEEYDSAWDELESSSYHEHMGQAVLASLYPRGKRAVNISDEKCLELARSTCLQVADWIELTGVRMGKHEHYLVERSRVSFVEWGDELIKDMRVPTGWQPAMLRDNETPPLTFPCMPEQLLQFVDTLPRRSPCIPRAGRVSAGGVRERADDQHRAAGTGRRAAASRRPPAGATEKAEPEVTPVDWRVRARTIADGCFDLDTKNKCRDSLAGYSRRVMEEMQELKIHGPRGRIDNHGTIQREALQGDLWWARKKNK